MDEKEKLGAYTFAPFVRQLVASPSESQAKTMVDGLVGAGTSAKLTNSNQSSSSSTDPIGALRVPT